jgi:glycerophosphoryl diester phosphodiesterase
LGLYRITQQAKRIVKLGFIVLAINLTQACAPEAKPKHFDVQGHRGCRGLLPENTIPGFIHALKLGVNTLELDVVMSADGKVVVSHEPWLNPEICLDPLGNEVTEERAYNLYQMRYDSIANCDCGTKPHPRFAQQQKMPVSKPLLNEVLAVSLGYARGMRNMPAPRFNIEIKSAPEGDDLYHPKVPTFAEAVVGVVQSFLPDSQYTIQSFDERPLQYIHQKYPNIQLAFLLEGEEKLTNSQIDSHIKNLGFTPVVFSCYYKMLDDKNVAYLHKKGMKVIPWTVNETTDMQQLIDMHVDGIITDYPDRLMKIVQGESE